MIDILGKRNVLTITFLGALVAIFEVVLTLTISNLISVLFSSSDALITVIEVKWVGFLIFIYLMVYVINYVSVNYITFSEVIAYSNEKVIELILYNYNINLKREEFVNVYVAEMFRVVDKLIINFSNIFSKIVTTLFLFAIGLYLVGLQFAFIVGLFMSIFVLLGLSTHRLSKRVSSDISKANEDRINILTSLYENRLIFMLTKSKNAIFKLLEENRLDILKIRVLSNLLTGLPRVFVDVVLFTSVLVLYHFVMSETIESSSIVFTGVLTLRLVPVLNQMYHGYSEFRNNRSSLGELVANYRDTLDYYWQLCDDKDTIIEWKDIHVHYSNNSVVLPNLTLKRGDHVLLRGPSGSGKSTFVRLILGQVNKVHGYLARSKDELAVSLCEQSALLFPGSVLFNITFRDSLDDVNLERLEAVCEAVCIFDFVKDLAGLATSEIDSMGSNFSGGQKQRIALARTLFIRAEVYIFDEATSALNTELQNKIYKNILSYLEDSTSIHVSHQEEVFSLFSKQIEFNDKF